ncbi:MAG: hypothetical protein ACOC56_05845 [Atribacterota bacterium]
MNKILFFKEDSTDLTDIYQADLVFKVQDNDSFCVVKNRFGKQGHVVNISGLRKILEDYEDYKKTESGKLTDSQLVEIAKTRGINEISDLCNSSGGYLGLEEREKERIRQVAFLLTLNDDNTIAHVLSKDLGLL